MPSTRRGFLLATSALALLPGCTQFDDSGTTIVELTVVLVNGRDESLPFRFALETTDGLGKWSSHEVEPGTRRDVTVAPPADRTVVGIRASVGGHDLRAELLTDDSDAVCPRVFIEFALADEPTILQSADVGC